MMHNRNKISLTKRIWKNRQAYLFLLPIFLFLCTFKYYTFLTAIIESFFQWNGANLNNFIGWDNYISLFHDEAFWISMKNLLIIMVCNVLISLTFPLAASIMVYSLQNRKIANFFKILYIVPMVVPSMVVLLMWQWIYSFDTGALNEFLRLIGLDNLVHSWLGDSATALGSIIMIGFPFVGAQGLQFLVYLGGLMNISTDIMESADLDGICWWQRIFYIELPLLRSQLKMFFMLAIINSMQAFENVLVLTNGGPGRSTLTPALYMYNQAFGYSNMGYASTIGVVLFIIIMILTVINYRYIQNTAE